MQDVTATGATTPRTVEEHAAAVAALIGPAPVVRAPLADAFGRVLAADLTAPVSLPPFDNSAMDGYAVRSTDVAGACRDTPVSLPVAGDIPAGHTDNRPLPPGATLRIMTGAPLPPGADAVVKVEETSGDATGTVQIFAAVEPGTHLRRSGDDVVAGSTVLRAGAVLGAAQLGVAAAVGAAALPVYRPLRALVLSTGSELVEQGRPLAHGQIYESNGTMLAAAVRSCHGEAELLRFVPDDVDALRKALDPRLPGVDLVITSGGVSAGAYEVVKDAFTGHGVDFVKVAMQPGGPQGCGRFEGVPVITLPGNPVSSLVSFEVFLRPALRSAMGYRDDRRTLTARLAEPVGATPGRRQHRRGWYDAATGQAQLVGGPGSHLLAAMAEANCLVVIPEDAADLPTGAEVRLLPLC
ncbi:MAG: molybdopterin molybdotransferase MoeA [Sciscionella sp.]